MHCKPFLGFLPMWQIFQTSRVVAALVNDVSSHCLSSQTYSFEYSHCVTLRLPPSWCCFALKKCAWKTCEKYCWTKKKKNVDTDYGKNVSKIITAGAGDVNHKDLSFLEELMQFEINVYRKYVTLSEEWKFSSRFDST